ncbi:MAG: thioredoxin family protein [Candidatus Pseudobacter hemicellulosilyticus]|uniref:Thioredoxin family protein n=1 Tax=Candidatus Pseudobacter hemicellulosilyticus TaxID=3121375 RepID=A0AAJ6BG59_9BACT|nr:MAG: thioredoxin family protein [Pseudobacter sp.]
MQRIIANEIKTLFAESDTENAFHSARQKQLPVLIDFWAPECKGCKKMEITTYQNANTLSYIDKHFVFVKYNITNRNVPKITSSPILWTPTFIVFANDGSEIRKTIGYLNDTQFQAEMEMGRALAFLRKAQPEVALEILKKFIKDNVVVTALPEALYWAGIASYFLNKRDMESLVPYWEELINIYPESIWADRADCLHVNL